MSESEDLRNCFGCRIVLNEPYLRCTECLPPFCYICLHCYATGVEFGLHENHHPYKIIRNNFPLFEDNWTAAEELRLLDGIMKAGIGNWPSVAQYVGSANKTKAECERHYNECYIERPAPGLPVLPLVYPTNAIIKANPIPCRISVDPPRPQVATSACNEMAGYMPGRGDFVVEFDNYAEFDMKNAEFDPNADRLEKELHFAAIHIYSNRLRERAKRKRIIKDHGLISHRHNLLSTVRYSKALNRDFEKLARFSRLLSFDSLNYLVEGIHLEAELKSKIKQLQEFREMGLNRMFSVKTYLKSKRKRDEIRLEKGRALNELLTHVKDENGMRLWIRKQTLGEIFKRNPDSGGGGYNTAVHASGGGSGGVLGGGGGSAPRRAAPPLEVSGLPGVEKLNPKEKELCSVLRVIPQAFLQFKAALIHECEKQKGLKLAQARSLIKIDVNKTRKIFDLLLEEGVIRKSTS